MSRVGIFGLVTVVLLGTSTMAAANEPFQLLGAAPATGAEIQTVGWLHRLRHHGGYHHYGHHHHGTGWHFGYSPRYSYHRHYNYYPRYTSGWGSFHLRIGIGPRYYASYPIYGSYWPIYDVYSPLRYAPVYPYPYPYSYGTPYYDPYCTYGTSYLGFADAYRRAAAAQTNIYVIAPPADGNDRRGGQAAAVVAGVNGSRPKADVAPQQALDAIMAARPTVPLQQVVENLRISNASSRLRARQLITYGDQMFADQRFSSALDRYKSAVAAAPDLSEAYFREGHAFIATNQFALAAKAFKLAVLLSDDPANADVNLDELYAGNRLAKQTRIEAVAHSALVNRDDGDLLFLVGMLLHHDGQAERARLFFQRAAEQEGEDSAHLRPFLPQSAPSPVIVTVDGTKI